MGQRLWCFGVIGVNLQPIYTSKKIEDTLRVKEDKPAVVNQQCLVYKFKCSLCDAEYVGYTKRHLHQRISEHSRKTSSIYKHLDQHVKNDGCDNKIINEIDNNFSILRKCLNKQDCLIYEMLYIRSLCPALNVQADSIRAKVFI